MTSAPQSSNPLLTTEAAAAAAAVTLLQPSQAPLRRQLWQAATLDSAGDTSSSSSSSSGGGGSSPQIHRIHRSLNLNTETGRLSARRPNLQNQPALEKDRYKVCCCPGHLVQLA